MGEDRAQRLRPERPTLASASGEIVPVWLSYAAGDRINDKYLLLRTLDQGGMGVVWIAHHLGLDIHVALKFIRPEVESPEADERLLREARAAARLDHPAIVHVIDVGRTEQGDPFLAMELLDGESLADVLERETRLEPATAMRVVLSLADALETMHGKGIIHRDVKPENVFLSCDDAGRWQPKLIDFGLARLDERSKAHRITQRGAVVGTPVYLSPERIQGEEAHPQDDVWALCVVLYEMITGVLPFEGDTPMLLLVAVLANEPRSLAAHGVEDTELWSILERGFRRRRDRWTSGRHLGKALAELLWKRGVTHDITGVSLKPAWLDDADVRRISVPMVVSRVATARLPMPVPPPFERGPLAALTTPTARPARRAPDLGRRAPPDSVAPIIQAPRPPGWSTPTLVVLVLAGVAAGLAGGVLLGRGTIAPVATVSATPPPPPPAVEPTASGDPATASGAPATVSAVATTSATSPPPATAGPRGSAGRVKDSKYPFR